MLVSLNDQRVCQFINDKAFVKGVVLHVAVEQGRLFLLNFEGVYVSISTEPYSVDLAESSLSNHLGKPFVLL